LVDIIFARGVEFFKHIEKVIYPICQNSIICIKMREGERERERGIEREREDILKLTRR
jgi:hypothetical protein